MSHMGKWLIAMGLIIALAGVIITFASKVPWLGRLPGDITIRRENFSFYFPLTTSIILSILLSFILWVIRK